MSNESLAPSEGTTPCRDDVAQRPLQRSAPQASSPDAVRTGPVGESTPWQSYLTEQDLAVIARGGFGRRMGFGRRPAVLVIDVQNYMVGEAGNDALWPSSCAEAGRRAVVAIAEVVAAAQAARVPCFFTLFEIARGAADIGIYSEKRDVLDSDRWCLAGTPGAQLVPQLKPGADDLVFVKKKPSGFHGTPLLGYLIDRQIDTLIVTGGSTSNCIRATVFDAASYNYRAIVPQEAVFDRIPISHAISLFDMDRQFADVMPVAPVLDYLRALGAHGEGPDERANAK